MAMITDADGYQMEDTPQTGGLPFNQQMAQPAYAPPATAPMSPTPAPALQQVQGMRPQQQYMPQFNRQSGFMGGGGSPYQRPMQPQSQMQPSQSNYGNAMLSPNQPTSNMMMSPNQPVQSPPSPQGGYGGYGGQGYGNQGGYQQGQQGGWANRSPNTGSWGMGNQSNTDAPQSNQNSGGWGPQQRMPQQGQMSNGGGGWGGSGQSQQGGGFSSGAKQGRFF